MAKTVKIYTTPSCTYCKLSKQYFKENGIEYTEVDVAADEKARNEMIQRTGQMGVPVIDIDGEIVIGFDQERLAEMLNIK